MTSITENQILRLLQRSDAVNVIVPIDEDILDEHEAEFFTGVPSSSDGNTVIGMNYLAGYPDITVDDLKGAKLDGDNVLLQNGVRVMFFSKKSLLPEG